MTEPMNDNAAGLPTVDLIPYPADIDEEDDRYIAPRKRPPSARTVGTLLRSVTFPSQLELHSGAFPLYEVARCVAEDQHPGDDAVGPQHLLRCALGVVNLDRLAKLAREVGGSLVLTGEIARECCDVGDDGLGALAAYAFYDLANPPPCSGSRYVTTIENAALLVVCGVLMFDATRTGVGRLRLVPSP